MARTYAPPSGQNYSTHVGKVVYKTATNTVTLATDVDGHKPCGIIVAAVNEADGPVTVCDVGEKVLAVIDSTATIIATTTFVCLGANSGVVEETSLSYVVGHVCEPNPLEASVREPGYIEITFLPSLTPAP